MAKRDDMNGLSFVQACDYLGLQSDDVIALREQGLVACIYFNGKQIYPKTALDITHRLLTLGREREWNYKTLAWYADLVFATEVGRAILLPIAGNKAAAAQLPTSWLETQYITAVLADLNEEIEHSDSPLVALLRSLVTVGEGQFWVDMTSLESSAIYPIIEFFEQSGIPIVGQRDAIARDAGPISISAVYAFTTVAPPISKELEQLISRFQAKIQAHLGASTSVSVSSEEKTKIIEENAIAVDRIYASKASEIHTPPDAWDFKLGMIRTEKQTIALQMKVPFDPEKSFIDNIIDLIRPYVGPYGARVVHILYEVANDAPYWRNPLITIDTNMVLDRLGVKRDRRGFHYSRNRERLRNVLNAAHNLEVVGEYTAWENGRQVRKALRKTVLSLIGATFDAEESSDLSTSELFQRGLPKTMQIRLNFYDGVRRPDGRLGNNYVMMQRLGKPDELPSAKYATTEERLKAYLLFRYRQVRMQTRVLSIARGTALEKAGITTKNVTRATQILTRALDKLVADGTIEQYSPIPLKSHQSFVVTLAGLNENL